MTRPTEPRDNHRAPDHAWQRPQPPAPVPDNIRQLANTKKVQP